MHFNYSCINSSMNRLSICFRSKLVNNQHILLIILSPWSTVLSKRPNTMRSYSLRLFLSPSVTAYSRALPASISPINPPVASFLVPRVERISCPIPTIRALRSPPVEVSNLASVFSFCRISPLKREISS